MSWILIAVLILIGLVFLILEILVIPGTGIFGIIGFALLAIGVWQTYIVHGTIAGHITLAGTALISVGALVLFLRSKTWNRAALKSEVDSRVNIVDEHDVKVGDTGKTTSRLAPSGKAYINDEFYEVTTLSEFIDEGVDIEIIKISYSKIYVKQKV